VRKDVENVSNSSRGGGSKSWTLGARSLKKVKAARRAGLALGGKGAENSPPRRRFLPPYHRYLDIVCKPGICELRRPV
jgi:hypothetical protein